MQKNWDVDTAVEFVADDHLHDHGHDDFEVSVAQDRMEQEVDKEARGGMVVEELQHYFL